MRRPASARSPFTATALAGALAAALALPASVGMASAAPASAGPASGTHRPVPLPAHGQRPVCGPPAAATAGCHAHVVTHPHSATPLASATYQSGYRPVDLQAAYQLPALSGGPGTGPTVAIVDAYDNPNAEADLAAYRSQFSLGTCSTGNGCFAKVDQRGGVSYPTGDTGWGAEIDLDIEMVSAACPACRILLVEADSNGFDDLMTAVRYAAGHAHFVSNSYGGREFSGETSYDTNFQATGVAFTVSSGDSGYGAEYPASSSEVTAVGGTSLTQDSSTRGWGETAWSGAGSGCSSYETKPAWQHDTGCARRTVVDVSAVADPNTGVAVYDSYGSSGGANWFVYGGTSVAAPLVAGIWALAGAATSPDTPYGHLSGWNDVVSGKNTHHCRDGYLCQAVFGYDGPTGLGTPVGASGFGGPVGGGGSGGGGGGTGSSLTLSASGYKVKGRNTVDLSWTGASGQVDVYRDDAVVKPAAGSTDGTGSYTDSTNTRGGARFTYQVCDAADPSSCSDQITVTF